MTVKRQMKRRKKKPEGRRICKCECGGTVRGIQDFDRWFTWCEKCTPVQTVKIKPMMDGERR